MKLVPHPSFDDRQKALTEAILVAVAVELKKVDAPRDLVEQLTGSIAFSVTSLIDDSTSVDFSDGNVAPLLTFQVGENELAYAGGSSWMHEYVYRLLPGVLRKAEGTGDA